MNMVIKFYVRYIYGRNCMYIADKEIAEPIAVLTGQKTLLEEDKKALEALGFTFELIVDPSIKI